MKKPWTIRVISPHAEMTLELDRDGPGIMLADLMRTATVVAYIGGAQPPKHGGVLEVVPLPDMPKEKTITPKRSKSKNEKHNDQSDELI